VKGRFVERHVAITMAIREANVLHDLAADIVKHGIRGGAYQHLHLSEEELDILQQLSEAVEAPEEDNKEEANVA
jgi:hypothetical protein